MSAILRVIFSVVPILALLTALIHDASHSRLGWLILELVVFPIGIIRGIGIWINLI